MALRVSSRLALVAGVWMLAACGSSSGGDGSNPGNGSSSSSSSSGSSSGTASSSSGSSTSSSGASSSSSSSGSTSSSGGTSVLCRPTFASGLDAAWVDFASDVPTSAATLATFKTMFANTFAAGGRVVRWWFHVNGTVTPGYDTTANGYALPISAANIADVKSILDAAYAAGVSVNISLWSFDMLQSGMEGISATTLANNKNLLTVDMNRTMYVKNVLTPLATALAGYHGLYSYEIFNEPEGMANKSDVPDAGWAATTIPEADIQRTVNWFASAIHTADPSALVTNAAWTFEACNGQSGKKNFYSDAALQAAGGMTNGTLDYYEVHYYADNGAANSPYVNKSTFWDLDKPILMGEFYALPTDNVATNDLYTTLFGNGYKGAWAWEYTESSGNTANTQWPSMQAPMQALYAADPSSLNCQ